MLFQKVYSDSQKFHWTFLFFRQFCPQFEASWYYFRFLMIDILNFKFSIAAVPPIITHATKVEDVGRTHH